MDYICTQCRFQYRISDPNRAAVTACHACGGKLAPMQAPGTSATRMPTGMAPGMQQGAPPPAPGVPQAPVQPGPAPTFEKGSMFRQYQIQGKLGQGGMGVVYKAIDVNLQRVSAMKILPPAFAQENPEARDRFIREARSAAQLIHQNIVTVFEAGVEGGQLYIAMEYVPGESVSHMIKRNGKIPESWSVDIVMDAAAGLEFAHKMELIHRDIKPDNILLHNKSQVAKVADFGLAKSTTKDDGNLTGTGLIVGTPHYMSPEQCQGDEEEQKVDRRTDIYSLGVTLFHMVTGQQPYRGKSTMAVLHKHVYDPVPDPRDTDPEVSDDLAEVIMKTMAKELDGRYQTAQELWNDLDDIKRGRGKSDADGTRTIVGGDGDDAEDPFGEMEFGEEADGVEGTAEIPYQDLAGEAEAAGGSRSGWSFRAGLVVIGALLAGGVFHFRDNITLALGLRTATTTTTVSTTSTSVATTSTTTSIPPLPEAADLPETRRASLPGGEAVRKIRHLRGTGIVAAIDAKKKAYLWNLSGETPEEFAAPGKVEALAFSSRKKLFAVACGKKVHLYQEVGKTPASTLEEHLDTVTELSFYPAGNCLVTGGADHLVNVFDARSSELLYALEGHQSEIVGVSCSRDQKILFSASADGELRLWVALEKKLERSVRFQLGGVESALLGKGLSHETVALLAKKRAWTIDLKDPTGVNPKPLPLEDDTPASIAFSWKSNYLAVGTSSGHVRLFKFPSEEPLGRYPIHKSAVTSLAFSRSHRGVTMSRFLFSGAEDGTLAATSVEALTTAAD